MEVMIDYYKSGDYDRCLLMCEDLLKESPEDFTLLSYYGSCLLKKKLYSIAIDVFSKLISRQEAFHLYTFRGDCYYSLEKYNQAIADYKQSIELDPTVGATYDSLARAYYRKEDKENAYKYINKAIEVSGGDEYDPLTLKAIFLKLDGRTSESFSLLSEIRKKFPDREFLREEQLNIIEESLKTTH